jgi:hypothetical protein
VAGFFRSRWREIAQYPRWLLTVVATIALFVIAVSLLAHRLRMPIGTQAKAPEAPFSTSGADAGKSSYPTTLASRASLLGAMIRKGETSLKLPTGKMYLYGMVTDGASPTTLFVGGQNVKAVDSAGKIGAAIAYGSVDNNQFSTQTNTHVIGGVSVSGSWDTFDAFSGSNQQRGAPFASANFTVSADSLVVIIGLASSQQYVSIEGIPEFLTDAWSSGIGTEAMIIGHVYLRPGTYTVIENSSAASGETSENMVDLIGVFVFGSKSDGIRAEPTPLSESKGSPRVSSKKQCVDAAHAVSNPRPLGTIQISSGAGPFSGVTPTHKIVSVRAGGSLAGSLTLRALDLGPAFAQTPLIETPSWGDQKTSWRLITNLHPGQTEITAQINERAPLRAGTYHIIFAFNMEMNGGDVASATNWALGQDVWNDGNDIAQFDSAQLYDAQQFGCAVDFSLVVEGYKPMYVPADAITVEVN